MKIQNYTKKDWKVEVFEGKQIFSSFPVAELQFNKDWMFWFFGVVHQKKLHSKLFVMRNVSFLSCGNSFWGNGSKRDFGTFREQTRMISGVVILTGGEVSVTSIVTFLFYFLLVSNYANFYWHGWPNDARCDRPKNLDNVTVEKNVFG